MPPFFLQFLLFRYIMFRPKDIVRHEGGDLLKFTFTYSELRY